MHLPETISFLTRAMFPNLILFFSFAESHETAKPVFITEPDDGHVLPNSPSLLFCEAKFVSKLKFNCTGGLTPDEIFFHKNDQNVTMLVADISYTLMRASSLNEVSCVCLATGYRGFIRKSRNAVVMLACKSFE